MRTDYVRAQRSYYESADGILEGRRKEMEQEQLCRVCAAPALDLHVHAEIADFVGDDLVNDAIRRKSSYRLRALVQCRAILPSLNLSLRNRSRRTIGG